MSWLLYANGITKLNFFKRNFNKNLSKYYLIEILRKYFCQNDPSFFQEGLSFKSFFIKKDLLFFNFEIIFDNIIIDFWEVKGLV